MAIALGCKPIWFGIDQEWFLSSIKRESERAGHSVPHQAVYIIMCVSASVLCVESGQELSEWMSILLLITGLL